MEVTYGAEGGQRGLLSRLRHHGVARSKRAGDLAGENGQREIPGRDAGKDATPMQRQLVALAGRALELDGCGKAPARFRRVAKVVHRLAQVPLRIGKGLPR